MLLVNCIYSFVLIYIFGRYMYYVMIGRRGPRASDEVDVLNFKYRMPQGWFHPRQ